MTSQAAAAAAADMTSRHSERFDCARTTRAPTKQWAAAGGVNAQPTLVLWLGRGGGTALITAQSTLKARKWRRWSCVQ
jgi:hypothetical protein